MAPTVVLSPRGIERERSGHPWIYRTDVARIRASAGDVVEVVGPRGRPIGFALFSDRSRIALRFLTKGDAPPSPSFLRDRLLLALEYRRTLAIDATCYRLVHGESDGLPGLVVDRYADYLVVQTLTQGTDRRLAEIVAALEELQSPKGIVARNDPKVRLLEGLDQRVDVVAGAVPERVEVREGHVSYQVDLRHGQKTGLFLDQRENRVAAASYARGRALDAFAYQGGFALAIAPRCDDVLAIDVSNEAATQIAENAARNALTNVRVETANVFDALRELERDGDRFDMVVLDPPAFAKSRESLAKAVTGYKEINLRALGLLKVGGYLVTCSCSYHVNEARFGEIVYEAALDAGATVVVVDKRMQARDHPVLLGMPESYYLKCLVLRRLA
ncbi:MAG: class I SAM-dependent rRNA methyltransferase [Vicinamibacterales bacterium]